MENKNNLGESLARIANQIATDNAQLNAVLELLIEKGIITKEELNSKFDKIFEEEIDKIHDYINDGNVDN